MYKKDVKVKLKPIEDQDDECLWIEVKTKRSFLVGLMYRASYTDLLTEKEGNTKLNKELESAHVISNNVILLGDLNCDTSQTHPDPTTTTLMDTCFTYQMTQLINTPTRITEKCMTTIDHIWSDKSNGLITESGTFLGISDHLGTYAKLDLKPSKKADSKTKLRRNWRNYSINEFKVSLQTRLEESEINRKIGDKDIDGSLLELTNVIQATMDKHAPMVEVRERKKQNTNIPWFDNEIEDKKHEKNRLFKLFNLLGDKKDKIAANKLNNAITHLKEKKKKAYYTNKLAESEGDPKKTWNILKELTNGYKETTDIEPDNMNQEKVNSFNKFFATVGSVIKEKLKIKEKTVDNNSTGFTFKPETEETVLKLIERIRTNVAVGTDGINAKVLKDHKDIIAPILTKIINLGYEINIFPEQLKSASVKPVHKKNCQNDPANYRPISILSVISKVFERSAVDQLTKYFETNNLISTCQHAYRMGHSTVTCLAEITNKIYSSLDEGLIVGIASMDLSKAFDAICHSHLLQKLCNMGLHGNTVKWVESYLKTRIQKTVFKDFQSAYCTVTSGVPQGSILGPILFLCFTNDLISSFPDIKVVSYADDTQFIVTGKTVEIVQKKLEEVIEKAENWYKSNSLMSNPSKTEVIFFTPKNKHNSQKNENNPTISVYEGGKEVKIEAANDVKVLGVQIDSKMTWNEHTKKLRNKANAIVRHLHRVNKLLPMKSKLQLYDSLVASKLSYADIIWSGCGVINKQKLQCVQNFALKSILGMKKYDSATEARKTLKYLDLEGKRNIHEAVFTHKVLSGKMPKNITEEYLKLRPSTQTRSATTGTLNIPKHKTAKYENSVLYRTTKAWNKTSTKIRTAQTGQFKKMLQTETIKNRYSS